MEAVNYIDTELFSFAYFPNLYEQLHALKEMALPEAWRFKNPPFEAMNTETPVLERYLRDVFRVQAMIYNWAQEQWQADAAIYITESIACFHTGLLTRTYRAIYACFEPNRRPASRLPWYFRAFVEEDAPILKYVVPLPQRIATFAKERSARFDPSWPIRINARHILEDAENVLRIPKRVREAKNLSLLLETAVELGRRQAEVEPGIVAMQLFHGQIQFLLPIALQDTSVPDLAMPLTAMNGYYRGETCLTPQMAYSNARVLGQPTARWLLDLVE